MREPSHFGTATEANPHFGLQLTSMPDGHTYNVLMEETDAIAGALTNVVKCLVASPEAVSMTVITSGIGVILRVTVPANELGAVIGKQGRTVKSLRILLRSMSMRSKQQITLDITDPAQAPVPHDG